MSILQRIRKGFESSSIPVSRAVMQTLEERRMLTITFLSDLSFDPSSTNGFGAIGVDVNNAGNPLAVGQITFAKGIGAHANSDITWDISGQNFRRFAGAIGIDDEAIQAFVLGTAIFQILLDGNEIFNSGLITAQDPINGPMDPPIPFNVDVTGGSILRLVTTDGGDGNTADWTNWVNARLSDEPGELEAPAAVTGLTAVQNDANGSLSWSNVSNESGYRIFRKLGNGAWQQIGTTGADVTVFVDPNMPVAPTKVNYHVRAFNDFGVSGVSNYAGFIRRPEGINDLALNLNGSKRVVLSWTAATGSNGYAVFKKIGGGAWQRIADVTGTEYTDPARLRDGVRFLYHVRPFNSGGIGPISNYVEITGTA